MIRPILPLIVILLAATCAACGEAKETISTVQTQRAQTAEAPGATQPFPTGGQTPEGPGGGEQTHEPETTDEPESTQAPDVTETPKPTDLPEATEASEPTEPPVEDGPDTGGQTTEEPQVPAAEGNDDAIPAWVWVLVAVGGVLFAAILVGLLRAWARSRSETRRIWQRQASAIYTGGAALYDAISVELSSAGHDESGAQRWRDLLQRMDDLGTDLHAVETLETSGENRIAVQNLLLALNSLRLAAQSHVTQMSQAEPAESETALRQRLTEIDEALQALRTRL